MSAAKPIDWSQYESAPATPQIDFSKYESAAPDATDAHPVPKSWTDSVGDFASSLWKQINPISGLKGAAQMTAHPIDTIKSDAETRQKIYQNAEAAFKKGNYSEGAAHLMHSFIPLVGPQLDAAANDFLQGNYAKGAGASVGMGVAMAGPEAANGAADAILSKVNPQAAAHALYEGALKPSTTIDAADRAEMVQTGLSKGIPISKGGFEKLGDLVDALNDRTKAVIDQADKQGATVNKFDIASRLSDVRKKFATQVNPEADLTAVSESGNEFLRNQPNDIGAADAQALKTGTYRQLRGKFGELGSAAIESQKALARGIKEELVNQFPELKSLGQQEGALLELQPVLERAVNRISNHQIVGIGTPIAAGATKAVTGSTGLGAVAGLMKTIIDDPMVKSKLAILLSKRSQGLSSAAEIGNRITAYSNALGNASNASKTDGPESP